MLAARAGRRRRAQAAERKAIELEQRDIILSRYAKTKKAKSQREGGDEATTRRFAERWILELTPCEEQRREMARRMKKEEGKVDFEIGS